jgi:hypothetical protein
MKRSIAIIVLLFTCSIALAQTAGQPGNNVTVRICTPSRAGMINQPPLWVIFLHDKAIIYKNNVALDQLNPDDIEAINVLKDSAAVVKYGKTALYGVIEVHLKNGAKLDTSKLKADTIRLFKN